MKENLVKDINISIREVENDIGHFLHVQGVCEKLHLIQRVDFSNCAPMKWDDSARNLINSLIKITIDDLFERNYIKEIGQGG